MRRVGVGMAAVAAAGGLVALALSRAAPGTEPVDPGGALAASAALDGDTDAPSDDVDATESPAEVGSLEAIDLGDAREESRTGPGGTAPAVGLVYARPPTVAPGASAEEVRSIAVVRAHLLAGNTERALAAAERYVETHKRTRDRDAAWLVIGMLHREAGRHNSAADAFKRLRVNDGALGMIGAWYEAEQELARGRYASAAARCVDYRTKWPDGLHAEECVEVLARAHAAQGHADDARKFAKEWDDAHAKAPIGEQVELQLALWEAEHKVSVAIPHLKSLAIEYGAPLTGRVAEETLAALNAAGHADAVVPDDVASRKLRAVSLRDSGRLDEGWALYEALRAEAAGPEADDARLVKWVADQAVPFGWRTRRFAFVAEVLQARYDEKPTARDAWEIQNALGRAGQWAEAAAWCKKGLERHAGTREWRRKEEDIARVYLLAGDPLAARAILDVAAARPGATGRSAAFLAGFASWRAGEHEDAVTRLTAVIDRNREQLPEARYWRAKALDALGRTAEADADRAWVREHAPYAWEGVLLASADAPTEAPFGRVGRWPGRELPPLPGVEEVAPRSTFALAAFAPADARLGGAGFGAFAWATGGAASDVAAPTFGSLLPPLERDPSSPPPSYGAGWDTKKAAEGMKALAEKHGASFPLLPAIEDMARIGLYDLSGPLFAQFSEDVHKWSRQSRNPHALASRAVLTEVEDWNLLYLHTRDHNHTARNLWANWTTAETAEQRLNGYRLAYPLAHDRYVWAHGAEQDVDPYLVIGLMRQESTYNPLAMSPVGARGAMQIMPKTGHLLANLAHDTSFTTADLEDPVFAVGYGITYLGLLLDRFDGNFPLAVAAYNGGPHNVSRFLQGDFGTGLGPADGKDVPLDVFVESMPYRETRNYVKVVTGNYATYLALYAPRGTSIRVPMTVTRDDKTVVDF